MTTVSGVTKPLRVTCAYLKSRMQVAVSARCGVWSPGREWQDQCAARPAGIVESDQVSQRVACVTKHELNPDQSPTTGHRSPTGQTVIWGWVIYRTIGEGSSLQEQEWFKDSCLTKAHPQRG